MHQGTEMSGFDPASITRPHDSLLTYYAICSLAGFILAPLVFVPHWMKFATLRYRFDGEGVMMSWGVVFRREINLTYRRIQDIHVTRNIVQRWMGLASVSIQTASGSATPEMVIEGVREFEGLRDFLYLKMRGAKGLDGAGPIRPEITSTTGGADAGDDHDASRDEALALLRQISDDIRSLREADRARGGGS